MGEQGPTGTPAGDPEQAGAQPEASSGPETEPVEPAPDPGTPPRGDGADWLDDPRVAAAREDLAQRLGLEVEAIEVSKANEIEWNDGALGCPEEGMDYSQALVPGYVVVLRARGETHRYHGALGKPPFHCPR